MNPFTGQNNDKISLLTPEKDRVPTGCQYHKINNFKEFKPVMIPFQSGQYNPNCARNLMPQAVPIPISVNIY